MSSLTVMASVAGASFAASFVEAVEALTVVLAVGVSRGWRPALFGAAAALAALALMVAVLGPLIGWIPISALQAVVGVLLLLFGLRWLRKAILRAIGVVALHDEGRRLLLAALAAERLRSLPPISLALVLREPLAHHTFLTVFPALKSYTCGSHNAYMAGISLWTVWTAPGSTALELAETCPKLPYA